MPSISVIIPVYNGEKTIQKTVLSILNQTFTDFELIIINDGSTDSTIEILSNIQDSRLKVFTCSNAGLAASRNRGIDKALGDYIAFIDADDLWTPDKLEAQYKALQENPQAAVAYSWTNSIDEAGNLVRSGSCVSASGDVHANLLLLNFLENGSNALFRRQALTEVGNFDESLTSAEDWDMYLRLAARYHFVVIPYPQVLYRISVNSMSANVDKLEKESLKVIERHFKQVPESLQYIKRVSIANLYKYLTFKCLEGYPRRKKGIKVTFLLLNLIRYDPTMFWKKVTWKILFRSLVMTLMPPEQAQTLLLNAKNRANITPLLLHIQRDI
jgi:glycosyltransferase involved in cell wall biosynthesis